MRNVSSSSTASTQPVAPKKDSREAQVVAAMLKDPPRTMFLTPFATIAKYKPLSQDLLLLSGDGAWAT